MDVWERIYKEKGKYFLKPHESMPKITSAFKKNGVKRVLDLGCGSGRHLVYLAKMGFDTYGIDSSPAGVELARKWLRREHLRAHLKNQDIYQKLPYRSKFFDAIISTQVLHHNYSSKVKELIKEMERILGDNGIIFFTVPKLRRKRSNIEGKRLPLKKVGDRTYLPMDGIEKGLPHFYFDKKTIITYFHNFKILAIKYGKRGHYEVLAVKNELLRAKALSFMQRRSFGKSSRYILSCYVILYCRFILGAHTTAPIMFAPEVTTPEMVFP